MDNTKSVDLPRRRVMLAGIGAAGAVAALAGCGSSGDSSTSSAGTTDGSAATDPAGGGSAPSDPGDGGADAIKVSDIPAGGGKIFADQNLVVTQPTAGTFKAFSATCTHQGCRVTRIEDGTIDCPCHGSQYSIMDGSVKAGPAPRPLASKTVNVSGDTLTVS
jgi:Rieske Fe-S protein